MVRPARWLPSALIGLAVAACSFLPSSGPLVHVANVSNTALAVHVNGDWVGTYAPGASGHVSLGGGGGPPYRVTIVSPGGTELAEVAVTAADLEAAAAGDGGVRVGADLPCGIVWLSVGIVDAEPVEPVPARLPPCD